MMKILKWTIFYLFVSILLASVMSLLERDIRKGIEITIIIIGIAIIVTSLLLAGMWLYIWADSPTTKKEEKEQRAIDCK